MANQEIRNTIIKSIKSFCNKYTSDSEIFSIADDGEQEFIFINPKSVTVEFKYVYVDFEGFQENPVYFSVEFNVYGGYTYTEGPYIDNNIRKFLSELQINIKKSLDDKRISDSLKKKIERIKQAEIKKAEKARKKIKIMPDAWEVYAI